MTIARIDPPADVTGIEAMLATKAATADLAPVAFSNDYPDLSLKPAIAIPAAVTRPMVTVAAAANGFQISTTQRCLAVYSLTIGTAATIGGASIGAIVLEVCPTNSAIAGDWIETSRMANGQTITLAVALNSVQTITGSILGWVPVGYYARIRTINTSGTPTYAYNSGTETLFG